MPILIGFNPVLRFISSDPALLFLTFTSGTALYRARGQPWTALFVASAYLNLVSLILCLRLLEGVPRADHRRRRPLQLAVLVLAATLNATFAYQVSKWVTPDGAAVIWFATAAVTACGAFLLCGGDGPPRPGARARAAR
ncbi:hypothetical protein Taro_029427 [Colocasia esculenta]|uniref:Uncharacterized protein n=1 Tax=Colocasia esculenta TaxID=4460 RepID=A0A843VJU0_COLES|nr:hypothetical protein [Colocasia esculenta]